LSARSLLPEGTAARLLVTREKGRGTVRLECTSLSGLWEATVVDLLFLGTLSAVVLLEPTPFPDFSVVF